MIEPKIAREVAEGMVDGWASDLGASLGADGRETLIAATMAGRLDYLDGSFRVRLVSPIKRDSGQTFTEFTMVEPTAGQLRDSAKGDRDKLDAALRLISATTGQPLALIECLKQRDLLVFSELIGFFS